MRCDLETLALSLAVTGFLIPAVTLMALGAGYPSQPLGLHSSPLGTPTAQSEWAHSAALVTLHGFLAVR